MSATGRGRARRRHDYYITPPWAVHRLLDAGILPEVCAPKVLDPAAGDQHLKKAFDSWSQGAPPVQWIMNDIREDADVPYHYDYLSDQFPLDDVGRVEFTIMNPPYIDALAFIQKALTHSKKVYVLLRLNWLASSRRQKFLSSFTPDVYVLPDRPSFDGEGTDASDYGWFCFPSQDVGIRILDATPRDVRAEQAAETRRILSVDPRQTNLPFPETA